MVDIYLVTNLINGKQYVGKTQKSYLERFNEHVNAYKYGYRQYLTCSIHKYGVENFKVELIKKVKNDEWDYWEKYYIKEYHTHYTEGGYNVTWGGDSNPMDDPLAVANHKKACSSERFRNLQRKLNTGRKHSEATKKLCRKNTLANLEVCMKGCWEYNNSRKTKVGMIENDEVIKVFDSLSDAVRYLSEIKGTRLDVSYTSQIKKCADAFNKNGNRAKFLGYSWTLKV